MGVVYFVAAIVIAGVVDELLSAAAGNGNVSNYDYHFVPGVGAVFGSQAETK